MIGAALAATLGALLAGQGRFAGGFALGAALAVLNYFWLHQAVEHLLAARQRMPWKAAVKFALRYPLAIAGVYLIYRTGWLPVTAILAGLFVPVAGVLVEAGIQICHGWKSSPAG